MPKFIPVPAEYAAKIAEAGEDPAAYLFDADTMTAVHKDDAPAEGGFSPARAFTQGLVRDSLAGPAKYIGEMIKQAPVVGGDVTDADRGAAALGIGINPGSIRSAGATLRDLGDAGNRLADKYNLDPASAELLSNQLMRAGGNLVGTLLPAAAAGRVVQGVAAVPKVVSGVATALGALQGGEQARQMAVDAGKSEGEAAIRSLPAAAVSALIDKFLSAGRFGAMIADGANLPKEDLLKTLGKEAGIGAGAGVAQQATTELAATGETSAENLAQAGLVGGIFQGAVGTGIKKAFGKTETPDGTPKLGDPESLAQLEKLLGSTAEVAPTAEPPKLEVKPQLSDAERTALLALPADDLKGMPAPTHSHKALLAAKEAGIKLNDERLDALFKTADKDAADKLLNAMYMEDRVKAAAAPKSAEESAMAMTEQLKPVLDKYNKDFKTIADTRKELDKLVKNIDKAPAMNAGQKWQAKNNTIAGFTAQIEQLERALLTRLQKENPDVVQQLMRGAPGVAERFSMSPRSPLEAAQAQGIPLEGEQGRPFAAETPTTPQSNVSVGTTAKPPVPDAPATVAAQVQAAADPASSRAVVLGAAQAPAGMIPVETQAGPAVVNPAKIDPAAAVAGLSGEVADPKLFGMSGAAGDRPVGETVVTADKGPVKNIQAEVVNTAEQIPAAAEAAAKAAPGSEIKVKTAEQVKAERASSSEIFRDNPTNYLRPAGMHGFSEEAKKYGWQVNISKSDPADLNLNKPTVIYELSYVKRNGYDQRIFLELYSNAKRSAVRVRTEERGPNQPMKERRGLHAATQLLRDVYDSEVIDRDAALSRELDAAMAEAQGMSLEEYTKTYNSGVPVGQILKNLKIKDAAEYVATLSRGVAAREAVRSAGGAVMRDTWNTMTNDRNRMLNKNIMIANKLKPWLEDPRIAAWINRGVDAKSWDVSTLDPSLHKPAGLIKRWIESFADEQLRRNIGVETFINNRRAIRPIEKIPGYFPFNVDKAVYEAQAKNSAEWAGYRKDFMDNWTKHYGTSAEAVAEGRAVLNDMFSPFGGGVGQPVYSAVRKAHGIPLPQSWRSKDLFQSMVHYSRRHAADMAYGTHVQHSPVMRRFWGLTEDPMGVKHTDPDVIDRTSPAFELAVREGERVDADWLKRGDLSIGNITAGDGSAEALIASFTGRPLGGVSRSQRIYESAQTLAGSILMQTRAAVRNASQMAFSLPEYVSIKEMRPALKGAMAAVMEPMKTIEAAKLAGAMQDAPLVHEAANVVYDAAYKTANGIRTLTGYNFVEEFSRGFVWNVVKNIVDYHKARGVDSPLAKEFGPKTGDIATETANNLVNRVLPTYDARTLPASMTPQMKSVLNSLAGLMRFSVARYNNWYEDVITPAKRGNYGRLIKSLSFGTLGSVLTGQFMAYVFKQKPPHLTISEWLGLDDEKKLEEVAPMLFAYNQMQGTMGIAGDIASYAVNAAAGKPLQPFDMTPRTSGVIIAADMIALLANFGEYAAENGASVPAVLQLGLELGRLNDSWRAVEGIASSEDSMDRQDRRAVRLYEELEGVSAKTGQPKTSKMISYIPPRQPFSLAKDLNRAKVPEDYLNLIGPLTRRTLRGIEPPNVEDPLKTPEFYGKMIGLQGEDARRRLKKDLEELPQVEERRAFRELFRP